ncbi:hypothetical protein BJ912DRAFT_974247 [Pholiota molesta]|nr:hypothetical protein BJ912DRAFT_974247 [Pholiota molesta]
MYHLTGAGQTRPRSWAIDLGACSLSSVLHINAHSCPSTPTLLYKMSSRRTPTLARYTHAILFLFILAVYASAAPCAGPLYRPYRVTNPKRSQVAFGEQTPGYFRINGADMQSRLGSVRDEHLLPYFPPVYAPVHPPSPTPSSWNPTSLASTIQSEGARYLKSISIPTWYPTYESWRAHAENLLSSKIQQLCCQISDVANALKEFTNDSGDIKSSGGEGPKIEQIMNDILL